MARTPTALLRGTLDVLILRTLQPGALHGYAVAARIEERTEGVLQIEDGALYQSLHRLEERGLVESEWGHADSGKRAKFYQLTREGRQRLRQETASWARYAEAVSKVLSPEGA
jgi:PadR family transcriptional regulator, regulatory protein PadR